MRSFLLLVCLAVALPSMASNEGRVAKQLPQSIKKKLKPVGIVKRPIVTR